MQWKLPALLPIIACAPKISGILPSYPRVHHTHAVSPVPSLLEDVSVPGWMSAHTHQVVYCSTWTRMRLLCACLAEGTDMCGESIHQACSSPPVIASQRSACHKHPNTFNITLAVTETILGFKEIFFGISLSFIKKGQTFAIFFPVLANVLVLRAILSWNFSFFVMETAAT